VTYMDELLNAEDPVEWLANQAQEQLFSWEPWTGAAAAIALRSMGLDPTNTVVGGDEADRAEYIRMWCAKQDHTLLELVFDPELKKGIPELLLESDPRFELYWEVLAHVHSQALAHMIASQKFRFTKKFRERPKGGNSVQASPYEVSREES
jgi:hypothetical protein